MLSSERRSLVRFLAIYLGSTLILFSLGSYMFYNFQKHQIIDTQNAQLELEAQKLTQKLRELHETYKKPLLYPNDPAFDSAIYDVDRGYIFGTFKPTSIEWSRDFYKRGDKLYCLHALKPYYLGASYLLISKDFNPKPLNELLKMLLLFLVAAGVLFTILGLFLGRRFIAPMKESIELMNRFIEDTTHELNTPISTILTNIELLDTLYNCEGQKEMRRIEMASKTLSRLYEDLTFLKLNHNYHRALERLNLSELLEERIEFFQTLIEAKDIKIIKNIDPNITLEMDRNDAIRLLDNLLSNAIKYNHKSGKLEVALRANMLEVENDGQGIKKEDLALIQNRFRRANSSEGGFGIGLDIIGQVVKRYNFTFTIHSDINQPTKVTLTW